MIYQLKLGSNKKNWHENHLRDQFQRNSISKGYKNYDDDDLHNDFRYR